VLRSLGGILTLAATVCVVAASTAEAATLIVANTNDSGPGSLREAIKTATAGDTIEVPAGTYTLESGELRVEKSLTIAGAGAAGTIIQSGGHFRVFDVQASAQPVTISGVTIRGGDLEVAGLTLEGGGVVSDAELTLEAVAITENRVDADGAAGKEGGDASGGGIYSTGSLTLLDSEVSDNVATATGGAGAKGGTATGAGAWATGSFKLEGSSFHGNLAEARGGDGPESTSQVGGFAEGGGLSVSAELGAASSRLAAVTISANVIDARAGPGASSGGEAFGGGASIGSTGPKVAVVNATVSGNVARGTVHALGGGVFAFPEDGGEDAFSSSTLDANSVEAPMESVGGGDIFGNGGVEILETIVSGGVGPAGSENCAPETNEKLTSRGHNLDSLDQCDFDAPGDQVNANPQLGPLQSNGGPVETQALAPSSPAVNAGSGVGCPATDARGVARPQGPGCDIGAFELAPASASTAAASALTTSAATLNGSAANPSVLAGSVFFQWGTSTAYGQLTLPQTLAAGVSGQAFAAAIGGLAPATVYHFRAVAQTPEGTVYGADAVFTTASAPAVSVPPVLTRLALSPSKLTAEQGKGASIAMAHKHRPRGASVSYSDSQAAPTTFTVLSVRSGFRLGARCLAKAPRHHKGQLERCTRDVSVGAFTHSDIAGANRFKFTGRVGGHALAAGRYLLQAVARNSHGQRSRTLTVAFRVVR
jgi:hypothetical protein